MVPEKPRLSQHTHRQAPLSNQTTAGGSLTDDLPSSSSQQWTDYKRLTHSIGAAYAKSEVEKVRRWGERIGECARYLGFAFEPLSSGQGYKKSLVSARLCRVRTCPVCQWRRALKINVGLGQAVERAAKRDGARAFLLTLTVRNCRTFLLRDTIRYMLKAWSRLTRRKIFLGCTEWVRSIEVTRGRLWVHDDSHPHLHALLIVPQGWCTPERLDSRTWREVWKDLLKVDYLPQCDIREVHAKDMGDGCREVLKYAVKPQVASLQEGWLEKVALAIDHVRILAASASLKSLEVVDEEPEDAEEVSEGLDVSSQIVERLPIPCPEGMEGKSVVICYKWQRRPLQYARGDVYWDTTPREWRAYLRSVMGAPPAR